MRNEPGLFNIYDMMQFLDDCPFTRLDNGDYVVARPLGGLFSRFRAAWLVFTGRCDVLWWPGQRDGGWKP